MNSRENCRNGGLICRSELGNVKAIVRSVSSLLRDDIVGCQLYPVHRLSFILLCNHLFVGVRYRMRENVG